MPPDVVNVLATGGGQTDPTGVDGQVASDSPDARLLLPVTADIGGLDANVVSAGPAPGMMAGMIGIRPKIGTRAID